MRNSWVSWDEGNLGGWDWSASQWGAPGDEVVQCASSWGAAGDEAGRQPTDPLLQAAAARLSRLPDGALAAVVTFQGSFCPVTRGHVACIVGARELLLGRRHRGEQWVPPDLERFAEVVGFMGCNSDRHVQRKLAPSPAISQKEPE